MITQITLVVREYDEAIAYLTKALGFVLLEDSRVGAEKRWVRVAPRGGGTALLLARAVNSDQARSVGNQTGGRVAFFLDTDDVWRDYRDMKMRGVKFVEEPRDEPYGTVVVFEDLYGNKWDLVQRPSGAAY
jgi:uncharacterized glyoxalase superfamily protein PhnB